MLHWIQGRLGLAGEDEPGRRELAVRHAAAMRRILDSFELAVHAREPQLRLVDHAARVEAVATRIAQTLGVDEGDQYILRAAVHLHEIGMLCLPAGLVERPGPLSPEELELVRGQARISAEIARAGYHPRIAWLIENQYRNHSELARTGAPERDQWLAGIFRVADVFATVTWPRPYQASMSSPERLALFQAGAGTRFDPAVVTSAVSLDYFAADPPN